MKRIVLIAGSFLSLTLAGCIDAAPSRAVALLVDTSGTYADQSSDVARVTKAGILPALRPGDHLMVMVIDDASYERENLRTSVHFAPRPSEANRQKLAVAQAMDALAASDEVATHTDITGAMLLAGEYLRDAEASERVLVLFTDLEEDLPPGARRQMEETDLQGIRVVAMNVKRLQADNQDPERYRERLSGWEERIRAAGATDWRVVLDGAKLRSMLETGG